MAHEVTIAGSTISTPRLRLRPWQHDDAAGVLDIYGSPEVFAVARPTNERGARAARRIGMEWVGETDKYYDLRLQVFRLRKGDLDTSVLAPGPVER
ncbi:hypothetical protein AB0C14_26765 [Microbispora hainanensis]